MKAGRAPIVKTLLMGASLLAGSTRALPAHAEETVGVAVEYFAFPGCPSAADFWDFLASRSLRVKRVRSGEEAVLVQLEVHRLGEQAEGRLVVSHGGTPSEPRSVTAQDCAGVVDALALTAVLAIDPEASLTPVKAPEPEPEPSAVAAPPQAYTDPVDEYPGASLPPVHWEPAVRGNLVTALPVDLSASFGLGASFALVSDPGARGWAPSLQIGGVYMRSDLFGSSDPARFALAAAQLVACPTQVGNEELLLRPCMVSQLGVMDARGNNLTNEYGDKNAWLGFGAMLQVEYQVSPRVRIHMDMAGLLPALPREYLVGQPPRRIAQTSLIVPSLGSGVSYEF